MNKDDEKRLTEACKRIDDAMRANVQGASWRPLAPALVALAKLVIELAVVASRTNERR